MAGSDTIVALSTPAGTAALGLVRVSGPKCEHILGSALKKPAPQPRYACLAKYHNLQGEVLDQLVFTFYPQGSSYTGEPLLELACHGNPLIIQYLLKDLCQRGCRLAQPGEFTRRAYLNDKIDLTQAEAVLDTIHAQNEQALRAAQHQLAGQLGARVHAWLDTLLSVIAQAEAYIDFPEEDLPPESVHGPMQQVVALMHELEALRRTHRYRSVLDQGIRSVILGAPNAGKSSLLNAFLGHERALVSAVPGTTRDFITEKVHLGPYCLHLVDTAGLRDSDCPLETQGIRKTLDQVHEADLYLWVVDGSAPLPCLDEAVRAKLRPQNTLVVCNKSDLPPCPRGTEALEDLGLPLVWVSLLKPAEALGAVSQALLALLAQGDLVPPADEVALVVNARHAEALEAAIGSLQEVLKGMRARLPAELIVSDLRGTLLHLEAIVGKVDQELILDKLFSQFCIGK